MKTLRRRVRELETQIERDKLAADEKLRELSGERMSKPLAPYKLIAQRAGAHW